MYKRTAREVKIPDAYDTLTRLPCLVEDDWVNQHHHDNRGKEENVHNRRFCQAQRKTSVKFNRKGPFQLRDSMSMLYDSVDQTISHVYKWMSYELKP